ncbi:hypothetical protein QB898_05050 [Ottowia sp. 10c7w1]|uniref:Uncharacterized protein n=1 Tax=Ottowia cancrivicina TaxID=3040346 RepID=A0AAW6RKL2_9BURK|nr:hypothetical protein [Ottowia sp. 10c7w1]
MTTTKTLFSLCHMPCKKWVFPPLNKADMFLKRQNLLLAGNGRS